MAHEADEATTEYVLGRRAILVTARSAIITVGLAVGAVVSLVVGGPGSLAAAMFVGTLALAGIVSPSQLRRKLAKRVVVTDRGLDVWPLSGSRLSIAWDEISTVSKHDSPPVYGTLRHSRVIAADGRWIVLTDLIANYDDLVTTIERMATSRDAIPQRLSRRERLLLLA